MKSIKRFFMLAALIAVSMFALIGCSVYLSEKKLVIEMDHTLHVGEEYDLVATLTSGDESSITWSIDKPEFAVIVGDKLQAIKVGEFNLTATYGSIRDIKHFTVLEWDQYKITYVLNGGSEQENAPLVKTYFENDPAILLEAPIRTGYKFAGFYDNADFAGEAIEYVYGPEGSDLTLYAKWEAVQYKLTAVLNGGELEQALPTSFTIEDTIVLPTPVKEHYDFLGWFLGEEQVTELVGADLQMSVAIEAKFEAHKYPISFELDGGEAELPAERTVNDTIQLPTPQKENCEFLGYFTTQEFTGEPVTVLDSSNLDITVLYAKYLVLNFAFIGEVGYPSIAAALEAAEEGATIKLVAHEFTEAVNLNKAVTLAGPNDGVKGYEERAEEAVLKGTVTISAANVTLDGLRFEENGYILVAANDVTIKNIYSISKTTKAGETNRYGQIVPTAKLSGLQVLDSYLNSGSNGNQKGNIAAEAVVSNVLIKGNHLANDVTVANTYSEAIQLYNVGAGKVEILENQIRVNTDNFIIYMGSYSNNATEVIIRDNILAGSEAAETKHTAGVSVRNLPANSSYVFEHNYVYNMYGNTLDTKFAKAGSKVDVLYNYFELPFKFTNPGEAVVSYEGNAYEAAQTTVTPDYQEFTVYGIVELEAAYNLYKNAAAILNGQRYLTVAEALAAAQDGDTIQLLAKETLDALTIDKAVTLAGPNAGVKGYEERAEEAVLKGTVTISAANVTLDGIRFEEDGYILVAANDVTIKNIYSISKTSKVGNENRYAQIVATANLSGLQVLDSYLNSGSNGNQKGNIAASAIVSNVLIKGNHLANNVTSTSAICEAIEFYNLGAGKLEIIENVIKFNTDNFILFLGNYSNNATEIIIKNNILDGSEAAETKHTAGVAVRYLSETASYTLEHNYVYNMFGNTVDVRYSKAGSTFDLLYNYFELPFKFTRKENATITYQGNAYEAAQTTATTDYQEFSVYGIAELEAAYALYLNGGAAESKTITYVLNDGAFDAEVPTSFEVGTGLAQLPEPKREGYTFAGWFASDTFEGEAITCISAEETADVILYAKWEEEILPQEFNIVYDLNGGKFAESTPVGDSLNELKATNYISYQVNTGSEVSLMKKGVTSIPRWWAFVALKQVQGNICQIVKMANGSTNLPDDWDLAIAWHAGLSDANMKALLDGMLNNAASFEGKYVVLSELPEEATMTCEITANVYESVTLAEEPISKYTSGVETLLPVPTKENDEFVAWDLGGQRVLSIPATQSGDLSLKAVWASEVQEVKPFMIGENGYDTLDAALEVAKDGDTIQIAAGDYELDKEVVISKNITLQGAGMDKTIFTGNASGKLTLGASVAIKDLTFVGPAATGSVSLVYSSANMGDILFENVKASKYNSFFRASTAGGNNIRFEGCEFSEIGQFLIWVYTASSVQKVEFISSKMELSSCGGVENTAAAMFRMRAGSLYVYDSYFEGNLPSTSGGLFENGNENGQAVIQFNTFKNVTKFDRNFNDNFKVVFNKNLYLDAEGTVLASMPAEEVKGSTVLDEVVASSEDERAQFYQEFLNGGEIKHTISYELNGGQFTAEAPVEFIEGQGATLVNPSREGYSFLGWFDNPDFNGEALTTISTEAKEDVILYAKWEEEIVEVKPIMIGNKGYDTLADAIAAAQDGDVINIGEGTFTLNSIIAKSVSFVGLNKAATIVNVTKDVQGNLAAADISFEKMSLVGPSAGYASGKDFFVTAKLEKLSFDDCILKNVNTFLYADNNTGKNLEISVTNCHIEGISQFFIWTQASASVSKIHFVGNTLDANSCGATPNAAAALIRVRSKNTLVEVYDNFFEGTTGIHHENAGNDGLFENGDDSNKFLVKFNTFKDCQRIVHNNGGHAITFDKNLYLDADGNVLSEVSPALNVSGVVADNTLAASEEERAQFYNDFLYGDSFTISYDLNGGEWEGAAGTENFQKIEEINTGKPVREGYTFVGWYEGDVKVETFELRNYALVARWLAEGTYVGTGEFAKYATIAEALANAQANETIYVYDGTYSDPLKISLEGISILAVEEHEDAKENAAIITGKITVEANDFTLKGLAFTGAAGITVNNKARFSFLNNYVHDTDANANAWAEGSSNNFGFIKLIGGNSTREATSNENHLISGNIFEKVQDSCVFILHGVDFTVSHNEFIDYRYDGVRVDGANAYGQFIFTNNLFKQTTPGAISGIYFRSYSNYYNYDDPQIILIAGNRFENLGFSQESTSIFKGAIACRNFQEHGAELMINHNDFVNCYRYLRIRNQADDLSCYEAYLYSLKVEYNNFIGVPEDCYFNNRNASDSGANNPSKAEFGPNFYADANGEKLASLDMSKFIGVKTTEFVQLDQKVEIKDVLDYITYEVVYETDGVEVQLPTTVKRGASVELPELQKEGTFFIGWYLTPDFSDDPITKLENIKDNVIVYARFDLFEYKTINYVLDGGQLAEGAPTQYAEGIGVTLLGATRSGSIFKGWYDNDQFDGQPVTKISKDQKGEVTLYALWQIEGSFNVSYHLNGGNTRYATREEMVNDFIADFSAGIKKASLGKFFDESYGAVYADVEQWFTVTKADKWGWLWNYFQDLKNQGYEAPQFASEVAEVRGNLHNFLNGSASCVYGIDFSEFDLAQGFWGSVQEDANLEAQTEILDAYYPYHTFLGWYLDAECTNGPVKTLTGDCELYAKWVETEYMLVYVINNADITISMPNGTEKAFTAASHFALDLPEYDPKVWQFMGWFLDEEGTRGISEINTYTMENITVYGKWVEKTGYTINYVLNGGLFDEPNQTLYDAIVNDFKADYATYCKSTFSVWNGESATATAQLIEVFTKTNHKWDWLLDYWMENNPYSYSGTTNANAFKQLKEKGSLPNGYFLWTELNGWYSGSQKSVYSGSLKSCDYANPKIKNNIWSFYAQTVNGQVLNVKPGAELATPHKYLYNFEGWYLNAELTGEPVTNIQASHVNELSEATFYAKWVEGTPVTNIEVTNAPQTMAQYEELQLVWNVIPADANFTGVFFASSNPSVLSVTDMGYLVAHKEGKATITLTSESSSGVSVSFEVTVQVPGHWDVSYETNSYLEVGQSIQLNAQYTELDGTHPAISWTSLNPELATVENGVVTALNTGLATIRAQVSDTVYIDFPVTILAVDSLSEGVKAVLEGHNSNAFTRYNLNIGGSYDYDVIGSVNDMLFNHVYSIDRQFEAVQAGVSTNHGGKKTSTEFITVHYTGNMAKGATAKANADYFAGGGGGTSIHYVTGNDGVYHVLDDSLVGFHAGDGTGVTFEWIPVGVMWEEGDPLYPVWGISSDSYFTINGKKTTYHVPEGSTAATKCVTDSRWINDMGLAYKVVDGQYYMGTTWWCYTQVSEGRICNKGGNNNSIGIESAVNEGTDLWYTWQLTAQLVAHLMIQENLDITRVVGHHFYSAKNCPQPLLENDLEIWWEFIDMVELEHKLLTELSDYYYEMQAVGTQPAMNSNGRLVMQEDAQIVTYKVQVVNTTTNQVEEITLATAVNGIYSR